MEEIKLFYTLWKVEQRKGRLWTLDNNRDQKMLQRYFCPAEYATKPKPTANQKATPIPNLKRKLKEK